MILLMWNHFSEYEPCLGKILAIRYAKEFVPEVSAGQDCGIVLDQTCFYAEQGGQIFDTGFITKEGNEVISNYNFRIKLIYLIQGG